MDEPILSEFSNGFSEALREVCRAPAPDAAFLSGLERQLLARQAALSAGTPRRARFARWRGRVPATLAHRAWQYATLILLVALTLALLAIGPQRVLAQVQRWLGYVPGIGFVDLTETRVLASPIELTRDGITLQVDQVIAGPQRTQVVVSTRGFSEEDLPWPNQAIQTPDFAAVLLLPDGSRLEATRWELSIGAARLEFPALPAGINQASLLLPRLPLVPSGELAEDWEVPLVLRPASGDLLDELFPQPYAPPQAGDSHHGVTLRVLDVAQTATETAIHYQIEWSDPDWVFRFGLGANRLPELRDDLGHIYWQSPQSQASSVAVVAVPAPDGSSATPTPLALDHAGTLVFPALSLSAGQASLWVDALEFQTPAQGSFSLDLGDDPQVGDTWPLDVHLEVAGFPVHFSGAHLREETVETGDGRRERRTYLTFDLDPLEARDGLSLSAFNLSSPAQGVYGSLYRSFHDGVEEYEVRLEFANGRIPAGAFEAQVGEATLRVQGPWEARWAIPGQGAANATPVRLFPQTTARPDGGIQPVVEEVFLSDRLTAIRFGAAGLPAGVTLAQVPGRDPLAGDPSHNQLDLTDNWGRDYPAGQNQAFLRPGGDAAGYDPRWRFFAPLEPLAQRLNLSIPGIELFIPAQAGFTLDVPAGLTFQEEAYTVTVIGGGGPERQETQTRWVSAPWPVEVALDLAGYHLRFSQAQVERDENADLPYRLVLKGEPPGAGPDTPALTGLRFAAVERPDGQTVQLAPALQEPGLASDPYGWVGPAEDDPGQLQAVILLNVTDAGRVDLLPGRYRLEIGGVTAWLPGPWEMQIALSGE